ncbi:unnamed protein product [Rotaria magnacalcarata]|uniref:NmrA-like domain-containing protein n=1 Tax=Rotaria magnacalcarata TaxID=392030 RepID=A0A820EXI7_9BILA|nr:unnamed protein product [Rotaria magnacalcarata]CAF2132302.1 unnamed protein product [Rotaria magnacalcarata]CAF4138149.1 unnamed protein product [Rotaria magnacalcarata]CAF4255242.1 unnamed protein product [Rotaria magnacalcarata]
MSNEETKLVVVAGGTGGVGRYIVDGIHCSGKPLVVFSRKESQELAAKGVKVVVVDYKNKESLLKALKGVHTVISTMESEDDLDGVKAQQMMFKLFVEYNSVHG